MTKFNNFLETLKHAWPLLLVKLLDQHDGESLERLQLLAIEIKIKIGPHTQIRPTHLERFTHNNNNFLNLVGCVALDAELMLEIKINYFVRGARKYFKADLNADWALDTQQISTFNALDASNFFNSEALAELNGRAALHVPSELIMSKLIEHALKLWPKGREGPEHFSFSFKKALTSKDDFTIAHKSGDSDVELALLTNNEVIIAMNAA